MSVLLLFTILLASLSIGALSAAITLTTQSTVTQFSDLKLAPLTQLPQILYQDNGDQQLKLIQCDDMDCKTWKTTTVSTLDGQNDIAGAYCSLQVSTANSKLYISSLWSQNKQPRVWECSTDMTCKSAIVNTNTLELYAYTIVTRSTPEQHLTFIKKNDNTLFYQQFVGVGFGTGPERALVEDVSSKAFLSILADDGFRFAFIAFYHPESDNIWFVRCQTRDCATWAVAQNVDKGTGSGSNSDVGSYISMTLVDTKVYLAYYWVGSAALRAMYCPNIDGPYTDCEAFTVEDPGTVNVGKYTSIALSTSRSKFYITYYDQSNGNLRVASCNLDRKCNVYAAEVGAGQMVGLYTSAGIDSLGLLSAIYHDDSVKTLKYLRENFGQPATGEPGTTAIASTTGDSASTGSTTSTGSTGTTHAQTTAASTTTETSTTSSVSTSASTDVSTTDATTTDSSTTTESSSTTSGGVGIFHPSLVLIVLTTFFPCFLTL